MKLDAHFNKTIVVETLHLWCCQYKRIKAKL